MNILMTMQQQNGSDRLKIKLRVSGERYREIADELTAKGIEIDDTADLMLTEQHSPAAFLIGKRDDEIYRLNTAEISHIESFAHDVIAYTDSGAFKISERLKTLALILDPGVFIRVSNSVILSVNHIQSIKPAFTQKFIVTMKSGAKIDVTRSYYYIFKEFFGI